MVTTQGGHRSRVASDKIVDGLHRLRLGFVNAYLLETDDGLAGSAPAITG